MLKAGAWLSWCGLLNKMRVLGLVPARGGSKGIPRKNVRELNGKPLIAYTFEQAKRASAITDIVCSTDDDEVSSLASKWGVGLPFRRPLALATDTASIKDVVVHALDTLANAGRDYDAVMLLQPTSPFRSAEDIDAAVEILRNEDADCVISLSVVSHQHPFYMYRLAGGRPIPLFPESVGIRRQEFAEIYIRNGAIYLTRTSALRMTGSLYGRSQAAYVMPAERSINIDEQADWDLAERYLVGQSRGSGYDTHTQR